MTLTSFGPVDITLGLACIIIGIIVGVYTHKNPNTFIDSFNWKGWIASVGFIILGVMCLMGKGGDFVTNIKDLLI